MYVLTHLHDYVQELLVLVQVLHADDVRVVHQLQHYTHRRTYRQMDRLVRCNAVQVLSCAVLLTTEVAGREGGRESVCVRVC